MNEMKDKQVNIEKADLTTEKPKWYKFLMIICVLLLLLWPLYFLFITICIDDPSNTKNTGLFYAVFNSLPIIYIASLITSSKIYKRHKILSVVFLLIPVLILCFIWLFFIYLWRYFPSLI